MDNVLYQLAANQPQIYPISSGGGPNLQQIRQPNLAAFYGMAAQGARGFSDFAPIKDYLNARAAQQQLNANTIDQLARANYVNEQANALAGNIRNRQLAQNAMRQAVETGDTSSLAAIDPEMADKVRKYKFGDEIQQILQRNPESWTPEDKSKILLLDEGRKAVKALADMDKSTREKTLFAAQNVAAGISAIRNNPGSANVIWPKIRGYVNELGITNGSPVPAQIDQDSLGELESYTGALLSGVGKIRGVNNVNVEVDAKPDLSAAFEKTATIEEGKKSVDFEKKLSDLLGEAQNAEYRADRMMSLANKVDRTGILIPYEIMVRQALTSIGIDNAADADKEELDRLGNQAVMDVLSKFKGATSEGELRFARSQVGDITNSKEGIRRFALVQKGLAQRVREKAKLYDQYVEQHGSPRGFNREWLRYQRKHPFLPKMNSPEEAKKLPPGTVFRGPDNKLFMVPNE